MHEFNFVQQYNEGPSFVYTTGFWLKFGFPEVILFSMRQQTAQDTFWTISRELEAGRRPPIGEPTDAIFQNVNAIFLPVSRQQYRDYLGWSRWFYGNDEFECLQLVWPDRDGHFPWAPEASDADRVAQPDLTEGDWQGLRKAH